MFMESLNDLGYLLNYKAPEAMTDENNWSMLALLMDVSFRKIVWRLKCSENTFRMLISQRKSCSATKCKR